MEARLEPLPGPRGAHLEMVGAVLEGGGAERVAEIASRHAGAPVAVVVPRLGVPAGWEAYERYVALRLAGGDPERPPEVAAEAPVVSGGEELGAVLLLGPGRPDAGEYLHLAAIAMLTEVAVAEAREDTEMRLRGSFLEELLEADAIEAEAVTRRASRLGSNLADGLVGLCADSGERAPGRVLAAIRAERSDAIAQIVRGRVYALVPGSLEGAQKLARRLSAQAAVGLSSRHSDPADARRALEEAELVLRVTASGGEEMGPETSGGTYRLLFRVLASHPEEIESFFDDTVGPVVRYDEQYSTDLAGTLQAYLAHDCNMNATAKAIYAHRHTVAYRLDRIKELTGLDPLSSEGRERLSLGLKAWRIVAPRLRR